MITYNSDYKIFSSSILNKNIGLFSGFTTRESGDGNLVGTILNFLQENEVDYKTLVTLEQIHSTNIEVVRQTSDKTMRVGDCDGVITKLPKVVLSVKTADCLPIIFYDKANELIGISHQGWRGSLKKMAMRMVNKMVELGGNKNEILVAIGPGINQCCYDIDDERYYQFLEELDVYSEKVISVWHGKKHLNLTHLNYLELIEAGIKSEHIDYFPFCTSCDKKRFFSFRRGKKKGQKDIQEMFSLIFLK